MNFIALLFFEFYLRLRGVFISRMAQKRVYIFDVFLQFSGIESSQVCQK